MDHMATVLRDNNVEIACITEKWLNQTIPSDTVVISVYTLHCNDRSDGRCSSGVAVYVRDDIPCQCQTALAITDVESGCCTNY